MNKHLTDWLFTGITASTVLLYISTSSPQHPLAASTQAAGYLLALVSIGTAAIVGAVRTARNKPPTRTWQTKPH